MTLTDAGPLVALVDRNDVHHAACTAEAAVLLPPLVTTWPCFTEAMHLVKRAGGYKAQERLWNYVDNSVLVFYELSAAERARMRVLMAKYKDTPMDLADASLVAAAETMGVRRVFTVDSDFGVYRAHGSQPFQRVP